MRRKTNKGNKQTKKFSSVVSKLQRGALPTSCGKERDVCPKEMGFFWHLSPGQVLSYPALSTWNLQGYNWYISHNLEELHCAQRSLVIWWNWPICGQGLRLAQASSFSCGQERKAELTNGSGWIPAPNSLCSLPAPHAGNHPSLISWFHQERSQRLGQVAFLS